MDVQGDGHASFRHSLPNKHMPTRLLSHVTDHIKNVLKRVSFGSKDCTKELKLEWAYIRSLYLQIRFSGLI